METTLMYARVAKIQKYEKLKKEISYLKQNNIPVHLVVVQLGDNVASNVYIRQKERACKELGINFTNLKLPLDTSYENLKLTVEKLNNDKRISSIIIQFPLPEHLAHKSITSLVLPSKDGDGLHPENQGKQLINDPSFSPVACTPQGIMNLLEAYQIDLKHKHVVIIGRSVIVGKPLISLLLNAQATVSMMHTRTSAAAWKNLLQNADVVISATGKKDVFSPDEVKTGVILIDVGIVREANGKIRGDLTYQNFIGKASYLTPVPGGVGPMTVTMLLSNTVSLAYQAWKGKEND